MSRRLGLAVVAAAALAGCSALSPYAATGQRALLVPEKIAWRAAPPGLPGGAKAAVLEGDPTKRGVFTMRIKLPAGYQIPPHWHPQTERLTVISGTFGFGMGTHFTRKGLVEYPPGSFVLMPPKMAHFANAAEENVLQVTSTGPLEIVYVNPDDDPRSDAD